MTTPGTRTVYYVAGSLDGFIATEDDSLEWLFPLGDPSESSYPEFIADVGAIAMGSTTYEWIQRNSEKAQAESVSSWPYVQPTWVFTKRKLEAVPGADIRFFSGDAGVAHAEMRAASRGKIIWIVGGGDLAGQFYDAGLLDEIIVQLGAVTLGQGKSLLPRRILSPALRLAAIRQMGDRMVELRFEVPRSPQQMPEPTPGLFQLVLAQRSSKSFRTKWIGKARCQWADHVPVSIAE